tara:strand:+ start:1572 stop:2444 length:873 start_codon:yes stop_codon:yes gene_type:complete
MPRYRKISPKIWDDERFMQLSQEEKLLAIYCLTSQQVNRIGLFVFSVGKAAEDLGYGMAYGIETVSEVLDTVSQKLNWRWDKASKVLYFPRWWNYNLPANAKHMKGCMDDAEELPKHPFWKEFRENTSLFSDSIKAQFIQSLNTVSDTVCHTVSDQIQIQNTGADLDSDNNPPKSPQGESEGTETGTRKIKKATESNPFAGVDVPDELTTDRFMDLWSDYVAHRGNLGKPLTHQAVKRAINKLLKMGHDGAIDALEHSMANGWTGVHKPEGNRSGQSFEEVLDQMQEIEE